MPADNARDDRVTGDSKEENLPVQVSAVSEAAGREATAARVADRGKPYIMPHSTIQLPKGTGGVDTLNICVYGQWSAKAWSIWRGRLNAAKERAAKASHSDGEFILSPFNDDILVLPRGARHGIQCAWAIKWRGCDLDIVDRHEEHPRVASLFVKIPSRVLMALDAWSAWSEIHQLLEAMGFEHSRQIVSRLDECSDFPGLAVQPFVDLYREGRFVCRGRTRGSWGTNPTIDTGLQLGKGAVLLRIYDKALESKHDEYKRELLIAGRWEGEDCEQAARVEFQLRRAALKSFSPGFVRHLLSVLPSIVGYCCERWCRITAGVVKSNNYGRETVDPLWQTVCDAFRTWSNYEEPGVPQRRTVQPEARPLYRQALGCLSTALAVSGKQIESAEDASNAILEAFKFDLGELAQRTNEKRRLWQVNSGARLNPPSEIPH